MKSILTVFLLCLAAVLHGQKEKPAECAANAGPDQTICFNEPMTLNAPMSLDYDLSSPTNISWSAGFVTPPVSFLPNPNSFDVTVTDGSATWNPGTYNFKFCATCRDLNNDGVKDVVCDESVVTVTPPATQAQIIEPDGTQDGHFTLCHEGDVMVNAAANGELSALSILPSDGLVHIVQTSATTYHLVRTGHGSPFQGTCEYTLSYVISNGGCESRVNTTVKFIQPQDGNLDGTIEGHIRPGCPLCTNRVSLEGDRPGCDGQGVWTVVQSPPGATWDFDPVYTNPLTGDAVVTVSEPGTYTFQYDVTNIDPCANSSFQITCDIFQVGEFTIGYDKIVTLCDNKIPKGTTYHFEFLQLPNTIYNWIPDNAALLGVATPHDYQSDVTALQDIDLGIYGTGITVTATKFFMDPDCEGPLPYEEIILPYSNADENWNYIQELIKKPGICFATCVNVAYVRFYGAPTVKMDQENISFLCTDGSETVRLGDYFDVTNGTPYFAEINVLSQPPGSSLSSPVSEYDFLQLQVDGCGQYVFEINAKTYNYAVSPPIVCTTTRILTITLEEAQPVSAGTDQIRCCVDPDIRLNGNNPFECGAQGTWKLIYCSSGCTVDFDDPHDPNTRITVHDDCRNLPVVMDFEWSFNSEDPSCLLTDTTRVTLDSICCTSCHCPEYHVNWACVEGQVVLTLLDQNNTPIDATVYTVNWNVNGTPGSTNPFAVSATPGVPMPFTVEVYLVENGNRVCSDMLTGSAYCPPTQPEGCGVRVVESCDECGNITLTLVDIVTGLPVVEIPFVHEIRWLIYGEGADDTSPLGVPHVNPITLPPGACYKIDYRRYYYAPGQQPIPGTWTDICDFEEGPICPAIECPGPCQNFPDFFIAGCGDVLDQTLNLTFPGGCFNVCNSVTGSYVTLGVFHTSTGLPVDPTQYNIVWENGSTGTYVNGQLSTINSVTITSKQRPCCFWKDAYLPVCCDREPFAVRCEQPITKYCKPDGTVTYVNGVPQISWIGVAGAVGYELEISFDGGGEEKCCEPNGNPTQYITVTSSPWPIPLTWDCFTIRVRAIYPEGVCEGSEWSAPYVYCPKVVVCDPVITVCGCCGHGRSEEFMSLPVVMVSEEELKAYLKAHPGPAYPSLQEALTAIGYISEATPSFSVFPNPANDAITVHPAQATKGVFTVQVTDMLQRQRLTLDFDGAGDAYLNVSDYPKGLYIVTIRDAQGNLIQAEKITVLR